MVTTTTKAIKSGNSYYFKLNPDLVKSGLVNEDNFYELDIKPIEDAKRIEELQIVDAFFKKKFGLSISEISADDAEEIKKYLAIKFKPSGRALYSFLYPEHESWTDVFINPGLI